MKALVLLMMSLASVVAMTVEPQDKGKPKEPQSQERQRATLPPSSAKPVTATAPVPRPTIGRVERDSLTKFKAAVNRPVGSVPEARREGRWHWHPWFGWVLLPQSRIYAVLPQILPEDFVLPETVTYYQTPVTEVVVTCPHCGQPIKVTVRH